MAITTNKNSLRAKQLGRNTESGPGALQIAKVIYNYSVDGGAISTITPKKNVVLPDNTVIVGCTLNSTTALASAACNVTIGTDAGSSSSAILGTTNYTSLSSDAIVNGVPIFATPVKLSAKAQVTITFSGTVTAGILEIVLYYYVANN